MELRKDGVRLKRDEDEALAFLLTKAKTLQKIDMTKAVRNIILS